MSKVDLFLINFVILGKFLILSVSFSHFKNESNNTPTSESDRNARDAQCIAWHSEVSALVAAVIEYY